MTTLPPFRGQQSRSSLQLSQHLPRLFMQSLPEDDAHCEVWLVVSGIVVVGDQLEIPHCYNNLRRFKSLITAVEIRTIFTT